MQKLRCGLATHHRFSAVISKIKIRKKPGRSAVFSLNAFTQGDGILRVDYHNVARNTWEPFLEPWQFSASATPSSAPSVLRDETDIPFVMTVGLKGIGWLNVNVGDALLAALLPAADDWMR